MLKMADNNKKTLEMSVQERAQLEGQIAAENLKQTIYQAPSGYQTPVPSGLFDDKPFDDEPLPPSPNTSQMSPLEQIGYWDRILGEIDNWLVDLNTFEMLDKSKPIGDITSTVKRDYGRERSQLISFKAEVQYLRKVAKEDADDLICT